MTWKLLEGDIAKDPDADDGDEIVEDHYRLARRIYGLNGKRFPRVAITIYSNLTNYHGGFVYEPHEPGFTMAVSHKASKGKWWSERAVVPTELLDDVMDMLKEVKRKFRVEPLK